MYDCMNMHLMSVDLKLWLSIKERPCIPLKAVDGESIKNPPKKKNDNDIKKSPYDFKSKNTLIFVLSVNEYFSISHCKTVKLMWDDLQVSYEGAQDIKQYKINNSTKEYELFYFEPREFVSSMHMRFSHIINKLENLGKTTSNQDFPNKTQRSVCRE